MPDLRAITGLLPEALDAGKIIREIQRDDCGAVVTFEGRVRSPNSGQDVSELIYEAYEQRATAQLDDLAYEAADRFGLGGVAAVHRIGSVSVGEPAVVVTVAAPHRAEAFAACSWLIDAIKAEVAIWKKEISNAGAEWVGLDDCARVDAPGS